MNRAENTDRINDLETRLNTALQRIEEIGTTTQRHIHMQAKHFEAIQKLFHDSQERMYRTIKALENKVHTLTIENKLMKSEISSTAAIASLLQEMYQKINGLDDRVGSLEAHVQALRAPPHHNSHQRRR